MKKAFAVLLLVVLCFLFLHRGREERSLKPRILITNFHPGTAGGHLSFILSIVTSNLKDDFEFAVACPKTSDVYEICSALGVKTYACSFPSKPKDFFKMLKASFMFRKLINEYRPDVIHTNGGADRTIAICGRFFANKKPSIIQTFHWNKVIGKDPLHFLVQNYFVDANLFVSNSAYKIHKESDGLDFHHTLVIENAVNLEAFCPIPKDELLKKQLQIPEGYFVFGSNAGLAGYKRIDLMLDVLALFPKDAPFRVIALGRDPEIWIEKAKSLQVDHFLCFPGFQEDVRPFCSLFDAGFILSTSVETSSFASREMMSMGIPLISSFYSGLKDNVDNYMNGVFVEPGNVQEIYQAMQFFLKMSPQELKGYRENARLKAERSFNREKQIAALKRLYSDLYKSFSDEIGQSSDKASSRKSEEPSPHEPSRNMPADSFGSFGCPNPCNASCNDMRRTDGHS